MPGIAVKKSQPPLIYLLAIADQKMQVQGEVGQGGKQALGGRAKAGVIKVTR